jgi:hypothetical protein
MTVKLSLKVPILKVSLLREKNHDSVSTNPLAYKASGIFFYK